MGSNAVDQHLNDDDDTAGFFLTLTDELYDDNTLDAALGLDEPEYEAEGELVPLVELVSSEDLALLNGATTMYDALPLDSSDDGMEIDQVAAVQQQQQANRLQMIGGAQPAMGLSSSAKLLVKKQHGVKKSLKPNNPNKARDERKGELIYLRKKVTELEAQLSNMQAKRPRISTTPAGATGSAAGNGSSGLTAASSCQVCCSAVDPAQQQRQTQCGHSQAPVVVNVWQDIASRQSEERVKVERENIRLKLVLENQLKIAKSLEKILNKKSTTKDIEEFVERNHMSVPTADSTDADVFNALLADVDKSYFEIDAVFEANGLAQVETPLSNARMRSDATNGMFLEIFANKLLPFDMSATGSAVWHHFTSAKERTPFRCYTYSSSKVDPMYLHSTEDTIVENFILKLDAKGTVGNFRVKQILRRHVEQDRVVVVWRAIIEPFEFSDEPVTGVSFRESGYIVIKRPSTVAGNHTLLQTCYIFTPNFTEELVGSDHPRVGAMTDFVLTTTAANVSSTHQMIENVLLEQAMKSSGRVESVH